MPADIGPWDRTTERVENAIRDDELADWLGRIRAKGASVWLIVDSCHSGGMMRGACICKLFRRPPNIRRSGALDSVMNSWNGLTATRDWTQLMAFDSQRRRASWISAFSLARSKSIRLT